MLNSTNALGQLNSTCTAPPLVRERHDLFLHERAHLGAERHVAGVVVRRVELAVPRRLFCFWFFVEWWREEETELEEEEEEEEEEGMSVSGEEGRGQGGEMMHNVSINAATSRPPLEEEEAATRRIWAVVTLKCRAEKKATTNLRACVASARVDGGGVATHVSEGHAFAEGFDFDDGHVVSRADSLSLSRGGCACQSVRRERASETES
jgi:hypothetical protein